MIKPNKESALSAAAMVMLALIIWIAVSSWNKKNPGITLRGKIAVEPIQSDSCKIYLDSNLPRITFKLRNEKEVRCGGLTWLNKEDIFIDSEAIPGASSMEYKCNIAKFDLSGKLIDRIYEAEKGKIAWAERKLLVPGGDNAIASPVKSQIAYIKDKSIEVLELNSRETKSIYIHQKEL